MIALFTPLTGLIAQWAGSRLYAFIVLGLLATGLSFLFLGVVLTPQSTYANGLLPALLTRGLAIPIVSSAATFAVVSAVTKNQSGLAFGTLGMARNIGTAFGVAVLSQVYLFHINEALPQNLAGSRRAADQFIVTGTGANKALTDGIILQGFKLTALTCALFCALAVVAALLIRARARKQSEEPILQEEPIVIGSNLHKI